MSEQVYVSKYRGEKDSHCNSADRPIKDQCPSGEHLINKQVIWMINRFIAVSKPGSSRKSDNQPNQNQVK